MKSDNDTAATLEPIEKRLRDAANFYHHGYPPERKVMLEAVAKIEQLTVMLNEEAARASNSHNEGMRKDDKIERLRAILANVRRTAEQCRDVTDDNLHYQQGMEDAGKAILHDLEGVA